MTDSYAFLRTSRWVGLIIGALVVSVVCVFLGRWQWGRHEDKVEAVSRIERNWDAPAITLDDVVTSGLEVSGDLQWQRVELTGSFVPDSTVLLRNRPVSGSPAMHVLAVFEADLATGSPVAVVVSRGWLATGDTTAVADPPTGRRTVTVRLRVEEGHLDRTPPAGQVYTLNTGQVLAATGNPLLASLPALQGYGQDTSPVDPLRAFPEPARDLGPHLSYAFQWWFFAAAVPVGIAVLARRERVEGPGGPTGPRRRLADELAEDELIDSQLRPRA